MVHQEPPATFTISFSMPCGFLNFFFFFCFLQCTACNLASKKPQQTMWCSVDVTIWQHENRNVYFSQQCSCALTAQSAKPHVCVWIRVFCSFWIRDFSATTDENIIGNHLGSSLSVGIIRERRKKTTTTISGAHMVNPQPPLYWWCQFQPVCMKVSSAPQVHGASISSGQRKLPTFFFDDAFWHESSLWWRAPGPCRWSPLDGTGSFLIRWVWCVSFQLCRGEHRGNQTHRAFEGAVYMMDGLLWCCNFMMLQSASTCTWCNL